MGIKLRVVQGSLRKRNRFQVMVPVTKTPFVFGRAEDCDMRCYSSAISRHHCEIRVAGFDITIVDLKSRNGVRVNGEEVQGQRQIRMGDRILLGKLEFELIVNLPAPRPGFDPLGDSVCDLLLEADQREDRQETVDSRWYQIETVDPYEGLSAKERLQAKAREKIPKQKRPIKLPKLVAASADIAVRQTLAKYNEGIDRCYRRPASPVATTDTRTRKDNDEGT